MTFEQFKELLSILNNFLMPIAVWIVYLLLGIKRELRDYRIVLFGIKGDGGLMHEVESLLDTRALDHTRLQGHEFRISAIETELTQLKLNRKEI